MTEAQHELGGPARDRPRVTSARMRDVNRLRRSTRDRVVAGVAGGLGRHLDIDPTIIRVLLVVLAFFGGAGLLLYGAMWLFVPRDGRDAAPIDTGPRTRTAVLTGALVAATLLLVTDGWWMHVGPGWPPLLALFVAVVVVLGLRQRGRGDAVRAHGEPTDDSAGVPADTPLAGRDSPDPHGGHTTAPATTPAPSPEAPAYPPPPRTLAPVRPPRPRSLFGITMAVVLLAVGAVAALEPAVGPLPWAVYPATALTVIGIALLTGAFLGRVTGLVFMGVLSTGILAAAVWAPELTFGELDARPVSAAAVQDRYAYTAGRVQLDLTGVRDLDRLDGRTLDLTMRAGEVVVELPGGLDVDVHGTAQGGRLEVLGAVEEGRLVTIDQSTGQTTAPDLRINVGIGFGHARVSSP